MKFFITGANGLVGSFLTKELLRQGHSIKALKRANSDLSLLHDLTDQIEWVNGEITDTPLLEASITGCDYVIHSAAVISFHSGKRDLMYETNVQGTATIVNASQLAGVKKFCFISSVAAIGKEKEDIPSTEKTQWEESDQHTHYARSKYLSELEVWRGIEEGLSAVIVNPSVIIGPGDITKGSTRLFEYVLKGGKYYTPGILNYIDLRDLCQCVLQLTLGNFHSQRYIVNGGSVSYKEFFDKIASKFGVHAPSKIVTPLLGGIAWRIAVVKSWFDKKEPLITKETVKLGGRPTYYDSKKIEETLRFSFHPLDETISWTCDELLKSTTDKLS